MPGCIGSQGDELLRAMSRDCRLCDGSWERGLFEDLLNLCLMTLFVQRNHPERFEHVLPARRGMLAKHPAVVEVGIRLEQVGACGP